MAIKLLTSAVKSKLSLEELISYENKLREEVSRRESRFKSDDKYFRQQSLKYQSTLNERNNNEKFPIRRAGGDNEVRLGIQVLESTIKSKQSTLKGRKEILDLSFESYNRNLAIKDKPIISRRKYNRIAKFFDRLDELSENDDSLSYFYESENVASVVNEGLDFDDFVDTLEIMDKINIEKGYNMHNYSIDMIKDAYKEYKKKPEDETIEKIFEEYFGTSVESNE